MPTAPIFGDDIAIAIWIRRATFRHGNGIFLITFGLAGSLILGFLIFSLPSVGRFFNELEDWLSAFARFNDSNTAGGTHGAFAHGMSEEAARHYCHCRNQSPR